MDFLEAMRFRHACKIFDENKKISEQDFDFILEAGRLSPSSTGLEQWDFWVVQNSKLRQDIRKVSWNQIQITSCSHLLVILAKISEVKPISEYIKKMIKRRDDKDVEAIAQREKFYQEFLTANFKNDDELTYHWSSKQSYIAAANMMTAAASLGIDSCPIEGFDADALNKTLELDISKQRVALMIPFGYRLNPQPPKFRREKSDVVRWIE
ncbi:NAD(P)H-dependent oxidoreductase [Campylobacter sp.]|uniref:NAD(P)H-dependent oxidoreductase n=1 Tax=Campylobacter sp. TaxID=205 RepID=UPI0026FB8B00|nr:NAD(P)H-dependent oxidoreductase [Campylobacter sp.]